MSIIAFPDIVERQYRYPYRCLWCERAIWHDALLVPLGTFCSDECAGLYTEAVQVGDIVPDGE